jgi:hypothetical protein
MAWFPRNRSKSLPATLPASAPAAAEATPVFNWRWDDQAKIRTGHWEPGPPSDPPGLRQIVYHEAYREQAPGRSWIFPRGVPDSWWRR